MNQCKVCSCSQRLTIDRAICSGGALAQLAREYGFEYSALKNHATKHLSRQLAVVMEKKNIVFGEELIEIIKDILTKSDDIFTRNYKAKKDFIALKSLDSKRSTIQLMSNIVAQVHAQRMAELEMERKTKNDDKYQQEQLWQKGLSNLTLRETKLLKRLIAKVNNQNNDPIRPDKPKDEFGLSEEDYI